MGQRCDLPPVVADCRDISTLDPRNLCHPVLTRSCIEWLRFEYRLCGIRLSQDQTRLVSSRLVLARRGEPVPKSSFHLRRLILLALRRYEETDSSVRWRGTGWSLISKEKNGRGRRRGKKGHESVCWSFSFRNRDRALLPRSYQLIETVPLCMFDGTIYGRG